ncbi:MAG: hypothetical protein ABIB79_03310 [archaeon]
MMRKLIILIMGMILLVVSVSGFDYVTCPPDCNGRSWIGEPYPNQLEGYTDTYGLEITRITDDNVDKVKPVYPNGVVSVENSDGTLFSATKSSVPTSGWAIFTTADGQYRCSLGNSGNGFVGGSKGWWSATDPNVIYWVHGSNSKLYKSTINRTSWIISSVELYNFSAYPAFSGVWKVVVSDEHNPSWDMRYWALMVKYSGVDDSENSATYLALFDKDASGVDVPGGGQILGYYELPNHNCFAAGMSPEGNYIFYRCGSDDCAPDGQCDIAWGINNFNGVVSIDDGFILANQISPHFTVGVDTQGNEVMVHTYSGSGEDYMDLCMWKFNNPGNENKINIADISNWRLDSEGMADTHYVSAGRSEEARSWVALVPTDSTSGDECGYENDLKATITFVRLSEENLLWRVAHTRSDATAYSSQCFAGGEFSGDYYYFSNNWCGTEIEQTFRIELPTINNGYATNWYEDLSGNITNYHDADLDHDLVINRTEIDSYVQRWKGDMALSLSDIIKAIGIWKAGGTYS